MSRMGRNIFLFPKTLCHEHDNVNQVDSNTSPAHQNNI